MNITLRTCQLSLIELFAVVTASLKLRNGIMRTILAAVILMVAGVACGQGCDVCSPGTTPASYRITFAGTSDAALNGRTFRMVYKGGNTWESEWRAFPSPPATPFDPPAPFDVTYGPWFTPVPGRHLTFFHAGYNPTNKKHCGHPGKGIIVGANHAGLIGFGEWVDAVGTPGERDGNGPFVIPLRIGGTATVRP